MGKTARRESPGLREEMGRQVIPSPAPVAAQSPVHKEAQAGQTLLVRHLVEPAEEVAIRSLLDFLVHLVIAERRGVPAAPPGQRERQGALVDSAAKAWMGATVAPVLEGAAMVVLGMATRAPTAATADQDVVGAVGAAAVARIAERIVPTVLATAVEGAELGDAEAVPALAVVLAAAHLAFSS